MPADLALSHLAIVLLGGGEAFYQGERLSGAEALKRAGLTPIRLSFKEGLALNNGTAQMLATAALALDVLSVLLDNADLAAAMTFLTRSPAAAARCALRSTRCVRTQGRSKTAAHVRELLAGSNSGRYSLSPGAAFQPWSVEAWSEPEAQALRFRHRLGLGAGPINGTAAKRSTVAFLPFKGGKKHQPQDAYSLRWDAAGARRGA